MRGPDEIYATIGNVDVGKYRCAEYNFWTVDDQPEADLFRNRIEEYASEIEGDYVSPPISRDKLAAIIAELKAIRDDPLGADAKGDYYRARVIKEKRREELKNDEDPTWKEVYGEDTYHQFVQFLEDVLKKCDELGKDVVFTRSKNM